MVTSSSGAKELSALRPSASLVVINSSNEILLVHRNPKATSFAGMHVFPGGNYDEKQDESYQTTAIRETFEETGLLLASATPQSPPPPRGPGSTLSEAALDTARESIHTGRTLFRDFLKQHALSADVKALLPFTEWITPVGYTRRFHTRFYVTFLPSQAHCTGSTSGTAGGSFSSSSSSSSFCSGGVTQHHRLPTPDAGQGQEQEVVEARFMHPQDALAEHRSKKIALMPPQHYILTTLANLFIGRQTTPQQRVRLEKLSAGVFGRMIFDPRAGKRDANGRIPLLYEGDEARGGPRGRLHRSVMLVNPETKLVTGVELLRNFDILNQVESGGITWSSTKL